MARQFPHALRSRNPDISRKSNNFAEKANPGRFRRVICLIGDDLQFSLLPTMKTQLNWLLIPAVTLGLGACKKKEEVKTPEVPAAVVEAPVKEVPAPAPAAVVPKVDVEARAAKLGFAKHLPQDTEALISVYEGSKIASRVKGSKLWKLVQEEMGGGFGAEVDDEMVDPDADAGEPLPADPEAADDEPMGPSALFGTEFTLAMGKTTGAQFGNLLTFNQRMGYFQMRGLAKAFASTVKSGDMEGFAESLADAYGADLYKELLKDPQSGMALLGKVRMPPVYAAFKTKAADRPAAAQQLAALISNVNMLGEMVEPTQTEVAGHKFEGLKILGSKMSATLGEDREGMDELMDTATVDQLLAVIAKKDIVILSGVVGDYAVLFIGGSTDDLKLAPDFNQSLVASDSLAFSDAYSNKDLSLLSYGQKEATDTILQTAGGIAEMTNGLRDGLAGAEGLGEMRDLDALFQIVAEREAALRKLAGNEASGMVAFFEEGLKIESYGGYRYGMLDLKSPNKLAGLGDSGDVVLFANMTGDAVFSEKSRDYYEALLETAYALTMKVAEAPIDVESMARFKEMAKMFDGKFRPDMVAMWDAMGNDFGGSLGHESAWVVDLKGGAPAIPGIPQNVVDKAKVPRISMVCPVTDRAKLSGSWDKMNSTLTGTLAKISEMTGSEIPMQKPISSEKGGNTTWFFPMPFFTDDFLPSVTVGDKWFVASTSKNQALDLVAKADAGGTAREGFWLTMNFNALVAYARESATLVGENAEAIMGAPLPEEDKEVIEKAIAALGDLDKLTVHSRNEGGILRSSVHLKTR
jgi:hypothetical protein